MACRPEKGPKTLRLSSQTQCKYEIQSMLRKVEGVYSITVDSDRNIIAISGHLPPKALLEALHKVSQNGDFCQLRPAHIPPSSCPPTDQLAEAASASYPMAFLSGSVPPSPLAEQPLTGAFRRSTYHIIHRSWQMLV
uniref:HMA domain-containing protein n=1 Tax=Kalanchoe fedtschenkoi TaxID=63787 RepID=A0A7N0TYI6_KALFE